MNEGWASGHFGWFGLSPEPVEKPYLNYIGVAIACLTGLIFLAIRSEKQSSNDAEYQALLPSSDVLDIHGSIQSNETSLEKTVSIRMRIIGAILALVSGIFFGLVFTPSTYIQDHRNDKYPGAPKNGLYYIFSMYTGILFTSITYYSIYILYKRNRPYVHLQSILPGFISGIMWGIAQAAFIFANSTLSQAISFPLISTGPATIAALWSIFYLKDIRGRRNYIIFSIGTFLRLVAAVLIILSKPISD